MIALIADKEFIFAIDGNITRMSEIFAKFFLYTTIDPVINHQPMMKRVADDHVRTMSDTCKG